jgi:cytochrome c oxidase subunit 2
MKTTMSQRKLIYTLLFAAAGAIALLVSVPGTRTVRFVQRANADQGPRVIEIAAKEFAYSPGEITLRKGEPVILRLTTEDRAHGFAVLPSAKLRKALQTTHLKPLKIDAEIVPGKVTYIAVKPMASGQYFVICDHYCGTGHGAMTMKLTVVE